MGVAKGALHVQDGAFGSVALGTGAKLQGWAGEGQVVCTWGRTHMSKQCAADRSHLSATSTAPHRCSLRRSHRLTCQGHSPSDAALPPTIRVRALGGARPQSVEEQGEVSPCRGSSSHPPRGWDPNPAPCALCPVGGAEGGPVTGHHLDIRSGVPFWPSLNQYKGAQGKQDDQGPHRRNGNYRGDFGGPQPVRPPS